MQAKVKNMLEQQEKAKEIKVRKRRMIRVSGKRPPSMRILYKELKDVIICSDKNKICPKRWEELEIDFEHENMRYCSVCQQDILKVTNQHNFEEAKDTNRCISVPLNGVLHRSFPKELKVCAERYILVQSSRTIMYESRHNNDEATIHSNGIEEIVKIFLTYIDDKDYYVHRFIENCEEYDVNFVATFRALGGMIEDKELQAEIDAILNT